MAGQLDEDAYRHAQIELQREEVGLKRDEIGLRREEVAAKDRDSRRAFWRALAISAVVPVALAIVAQTYESVRKNRDRLVAANQFVSEQMALDTGHLATIYAANRDLESYIKTMQDHGFLMAITACRDEFLMTEILGMKLAEMSCFEDVREFAACRAEKRKSGQDPAECDSGH